MTVTGWPKTDGSGVSLLMTMVVPAGFTVWLTAGETPPAKLASPAYVATMDFVPAVVDVREQLPFGAEPVHGAAPVPSLTVTVPVGVPLAGGAAATEKLTRYGWPTTVELGVMLVIVVVELAVTTLNAVLVTLVSTEDSAVKV